MQHLLAGASRAHRIQTRLGRNDWPRELPVPMHGNGPLLKIHLCILIQLQTPPCQHPLDSVWPAAYG